MGQALEKHKKGTSCVIPIILRPVLWKGTPIAELQCLPTDAKPVTQWPDQDLAFEDIAQNISQVVDSLQQKAEKEFYEQEEIKSIEYGLDYLSKECSKLEDENWELGLREYEQTALKEALTKQLDEIARQIQVTEKEIDGIKYKTESLKIRGAQIRAEYDKRARKYQDLTGERTPLLIEWEDPYLIPMIIPGTLPQVSPFSKKSSSNDQ